MRDDAVLRRALPLGRGLGRFGEHERIERRLSALHYTDSIVNVKYHTNNATSYNATTYHFGLNTAPTASEFVPIQNIKF